MPLIFFLDYFAQSFLLQSLTIGWGDIFLLLQVLVVCACWNWSRFAVDTKHHDAQDVCAGVQLPPRSLGHALQPLHSYRLVA
jgi:hypothetical protein